MTRDVIAETGIGMCECSGVAKRRISLAPYTPVKVCTAKIFFVPMLAQVNDTVSLIIIIIGPKKKT